MFGRVSSLELGPHRLTEIVTAFPDRPQGSANGAIGMGILSRFVVTFDYVNQRMLLRPSSSFADPFEYNMTGLILRPRDGGQLSVKGVIDGSPAARRGIRHGDLIVAIDGRQLVHNDGRVARDLLRQENRSVVLTIERAGEKFDVTIKLERLI